MLPCSQCLCNSPHCNSTTKKSELRERFAHVTLYKKEHQKTICSFLTKQRAIRTKTKERIPCPVKGHSIKILHFDNSLLTRYSRPVDCISQRMGHFKLWIFCSSSTKLSILIVFHNCHCWQKREKLIFGGDAFVMKV